MHSLSEFGANVPAFLAKLWKLVDDPETNELISWSEEGTSFYIRDQAQFSRKLLPMYYKHNNMASFIRQLNMYGFHKIVSADAGSLRLDKDEMEFAHQCFLRGHPYLLEHIKRKVGKSQLLTSKQIEDGKEGSNGGVVVKAEFMNKILSEVKSMRGRQDTVEGRLASMKQENEALWRELSLLRQKHIKQQTIVNKLIQFLVTLVQPSQRLKRRYPLMLNSVPHTSGKTNGKGNNLNANDDLLSASLRASQIMSRSPTGTTIHELDADSILPDGESILPESDNEPLASNTITLHVPGTELTQVIDTSLEPEVMSPDPEVLESLEPIIIENQLSNSASSVPLLEVNSEQVVLSDEALKAGSPSPELLLAVPPSELIPAVVVPSLQASKYKSSNMIRPQETAQKMATRSSTAALQGNVSSKSIGIRRSAESAVKKTVAGNKFASAQYMGFTTKGIKKEVVDSQSAPKREMRVLPPRIRRKKLSSNKDSVFEIQNDTLENVGVNLLSDVGLAETTQSHNLNDSSGGLTHDGTNLGLQLPMSPMSGPTVTDVTSPLVVQPPRSSSVPEQLSPQSSPGCTLNSPNPYDMTLACTSQAGSSPANTTALKSSSFNRCESGGKDDLDNHVGSVDSELGQLKDFLNNSGIQLDANTLLGLFSGDDLSALQEDGNNVSSKSDSIGNELMYYQPDFMDLEDIWNQENGRSTPPPSPVDILSSEVNTPYLSPASPGFFSSPNKRRRT